MYDYVRRAYGVDPKVGQRVLHIETGKAGHIKPERLGAGQYVQVLFDGDEYAKPCHPNAIKALEE